MKFLLGLLLGLGLGVVIGFLTAPQSGKETLAQLSEQGILVNPGNLNEEVRTRAQEALVQGRELYSRTKNELSERYTRTKDGQF
jgi:gas vesicle protein